MLVGMIGAASSSAPFLPSAASPSQVAASARAESVAEALPEAGEARLHGGGNLLSGSTLIAAQSEHGSEGGTAQADDLSKDQQAVVDDLKEWDREVRAHEAAHASTGGGIAGSPSYEYEVGPDGRRYAVGGEVRIDTSPVNGDPEATIEKMETVINAALAPAEPSGQDRAVAAWAMAQLREAQAEAASKGRQERESLLSGEEQSSAPQGAQPQVQGLVI